MNYPIERLQPFTLHVGLARHHADWNWKNVRSPFARLYLVTEGEAEVILPSGTCHLTPGHLYYIPAFATHSYVCKATFTHYYIHILEKQGEPSVLEELILPTEVVAHRLDYDLMERLAYLNPFLKLPTSNPQGYDNPETVVNNIQMNVKRPFCDKVESRGILFMLLSRFLKLAKPKVDLTDSRILQALHYIRQHLTERIDISSLAEMCCMSNDHFIRLFKRAMGDTPVSFITQRRMEQAELLLVCSQQPLKEVALQSGYDDYSYFHKLFKKHVGVTPQLYREQCKIPATLSEE